MKKQRTNPIYQIAIALGLIWLVAQAVFQVFAADAPRPAFYALNLANLLQLGVTATAISLLLVTNTRRPKGIEPDSVPPPKEVVREVWHDTEGQPYGRRAGDVPVSDVKRVIAAVRNLGSIDEEADHIAEGRPEWANEMLRTQASAQDEPIPALDLEEPEPERPLVREEQR